VTRESRHDPTLQSYIGGTWIGREPAQTLHSAVNGRAVAATHAETPDFAAATHHARRVGGRRCWRWTSSSAPNG